MTANITVSPTTELEAVNLLLGTIGESAVETLDNLTFVDAIAALNLLRDVSASLQTEGWSWNTESGMVLTPDNEGIVWLPSNYLKAHSESNPAYTVRGRKLYDPENHTFVFTSDITLDVVVGLNFEDLPEPARRFIVSSARIQFSTDMEHDELVLKALEKRALSAWSTLLNHEASVGNYNVLSSGLASTLKSARR